MADKPGHTVILDPDYINWTKSLLNTLTLGGRWIIPDYEMLIERTSRTLVTIHILPEQQTDRGYNSFKGIMTQYLEAAGYKVVTKLHFPDNPHNLPAEVIPNATYN